MCADTAETSRWHQISTPSCWHRLSWSLVYQPKGEAEFLLTKIIANNLFHQNYNKKRMQTLVTAESPYIYISYHALREKHRHDQLFKSIRRYIWCVHWLNNAELDTRSNATKESQRRRRRRARVENWMINFSVCAVCDVCSLVSEPSKSTRQRKKNVEIQSECIMQSVKRL